MEAVSSRMSRASSRYGTTTVFSGPVRKWKKKWVHVSSPTVSYKSQSNGKNNNNGGSRLLLCRWTPITSSSSISGETDNSSGAVADDPPRRRFRYTPIAVLQEQKNAVIKKPENEYAARPTNMTNGMYENPNISEVLKKETQGSNISHLDLGLCLKGHTGDLNHSGDASLKKTCSSTVWSMN
ncbi:Golgin family A protein [Quillaja saponaria]|uniref:Golgin family A protein n=1 Tax=Quillaja saponaria TaxID=32244 RepID=A0AAD7LMF1_QUISA|nr:Golgin family A protein [Quillaja saponaria]